MRQLHTFKPSIVCITALPGLWNPDEHSLWPPPPKSKKNVTLIEPEIDDPDQPIEDENADSESGGSDNHSSLSGEDIYVRCTIYE
jgi:hypothetical protein